MINWSELLRIAIGEQIVELGSPPFTEKKMLSYLYEKHKSMRIVGSLLGVHKKTVQLKLKSLDIKRRPSGGKNNYVADLHSERFGFGTEEEMLMNWFQRGFSRRWISRRLALKGVKLSDSAVGARIKKIKNSRNERAMP